MKRLIIYTLLAGVAAAAGAESVQPTFVSNPANLKGGRAYVNPVIYADYSDPDAVASADGRTWYMTASSFQCTPGLPILKSTDLVNWTIVNYALDAVPPTDYYGAAPRHGKGVWAPCIREHDGVYYIYWGDPDFGIFMIKTDNPEGRWSEPVLVKAGKGLIDPTPLWDSDGKAYLANGWAGSRAGFNSVITVSDMTPDGTAVTSKPRIVYDGNDGVNHTVEGPKMYRRGDMYYMFAPAGGVATGWQLVMRSKNIYGPYELKIVMAQGGSDINGPHQGALLTDAVGKDWFLHFQDLGAYGRVTHLNPVEWRDGWPVIGTDKDGDGCGEPVRRHERPAVAYDHKSIASSQMQPVQPLEGAGDPSTLFQWHGNYADAFGFGIPDGLMRIYGHRLSEGFVNMWEVPNLWLQKFPAEEFEMVAKVRVSAKQTSEGVSSGIIVMGRDYARLGLQKRGDGFVMQFTTCTDAEQGGAEHTADVAEIAPSRVYAAGLYPNLECDIYLRLTVGKGGKCRFSYSTDGGRKYTQAGEFTARAGKWIGAKAGFYSIMPAGVSERGWIDVLNSDLRIK